MLYRFLSLSQSTQLNFEYFMILTLYFAKKNCINCYRSEKNLKQNCINFKQQHLEPFAVVSERKQC